MSKKIDKDFFIIDSDALDGVVSRIYGYALSDGILYSEGNVNDAIRGRLGGIGCYVDVKVDDGKIIVRQDAIGCFGLYLYQTKCHWSLSNSFYRLVKFLEEKSPMTIDNDYIEHLISIDLCSHSVDRTPVNEISILDKDVAVIVDIQTKKISFSKANAESVVPIDSAQGISILDDWFERWAKMLRSLNSHVEDFSAHLSGGFDSRLAFVPLFKSGILPSAIRVNSRKRRGYTYEEDYEVAVRLVRKFGFRLNTTVANRVRWDALNDVVDALYNVKVGFHKGLTYDYALGQYENKKVVVSGFGGECVRSHWDLDWNVLSDDMAISCARKYKFSGRRMAMSVRRVLQRSSKLMVEKYGIADLTSHDLPMFIYANSRNRSHFGKAIVQGWMANEIILAPLLDPSLGRLTINSVACADRNLLMAVIFERYAPELLDVGFQGGRSICEVTRSIAREISERYPRRLTEPFVQDRDGLPERSANIDARNGDCGATSEYDARSFEVDNYFRNIFCESSFRKKCMRLFGRDVYQHAVVSMKTSSHCPLRDAKCLIGLQSIVDVVAHNWRVLPESEFELHGVERVWLHSSRFGNWLSVVYDMGRKIYRMVRKFIKSGELIVCRA